MTKLFRYCKEYVRVFGQTNITCISLNDELNNEVEREEMSYSSTDKKSLQASSCQVKFEIGSIWA